MNPPAAQFLPRGRHRGALLCFGVFSGVLIASFCARFLIENGLTWRCPSIILFGLPCPSCGLTRAFVSLSQFQLLEALRFNPLIVLSLAGVFVAPVFNLRLDIFERRAAWIFLAAAVALNWVYLLFFLPR